MDIVGTREKKKKYRLTPDMWSATLVQLDRASAPSKRDQTLTKPRVWWGRRGSDTPAGG